MTMRYNMPRRTVVMLALAGSSLSLASSFAAKSAAAQAAAPDTPKAKSVEALVYKAVALTGSKGKPALAEFRQKGSEWFNENTYVFVVDLKGNQLFNAAFPNLEGKNQIDLKDKNGKYLVKALIDTAETKGAGWAEYMWPKPGTDTPVRKWSYVKRVDLEGAPALVGIGIYLD